MSLKISYDELRREIGRYLGFDRTPANWDAVQAQDVADIIRGGIRNFYWPPSLEGVPSHKWSFLSPTDTVSVSKTATEYDLPSDFVRLCADFTYSHNDKGGTLANVTEDVIRSLNSSEALRGRPKYCAIRAKEQAVDRYELMLYPSPDVSYTLQYRYEKLPDELSGDNPYHLGSAAHSETVLAACLMVADKMLNKESADAVGGGLNYQQFASCLRASIALDQEVY